MDVSKNPLSCKEARNLDMVAYLSSLGHEPERIRNNDYWYLSPLRTEKTPSFKVNRRLNQWYDHGLGKGGNLVDFAILYNNCTVGEFLQRLHDSSLFQQPRIATTAPLSEAEESRITIVAIKPLTSFSLSRYLYYRRIPQVVGEQYCREITYELKGRQYYAIGFKNDGGGWELRNAFFKGSSRPKYITTIDTGAREIAVFEGFFDFLSFIALAKTGVQAASNYMVLNSLAFFEKARPLLEKHDRIRLYLDRDKSGQNCTLTALSLSSRYQDESVMYKHYKDLNDWMMHIGQTRKESSGQDGA